MSSQVNTDKFHCNLHRELADHVIEAVEEEGGKKYLFTKIGHFQVDRIIPPHVQKESTENTILKLEIYITRMLRQTSQYTMSFPIRFKPLGYKVNLY